MFLFIASLGKKAIEPKAYLKKGIYIMKDSMHY